MDLWLIVQSHPIIYTHPDACLCMCVCDDFSMLGVQLKHIKKSLHHQHHPAGAAEKECVCEREQKQRV